MHQRLDCQKEIRALFLNKPKNLVQYFRMSLYYSLVVRIQKVARVFIVKLTDANKRSNCVKRFSTTEQQPSPSELYLRCCQLACSATNPARPPSLLPLPCSTAQSRRIAVARRRSVVVRVLCWAERRPTWCAGPTTTTAQWTKRMRSIEPNFGIVFQVYNLMFPST